MRKSFPFNLTHIHPDGYHPVVKAYLQRKPINLVVDTGASRTVFHSALLNHLNPIEEEHSEPLAAGITAQQISVCRYRISSLTIARNQFRNLEVFGADLSNLAELYHQMVGFPLHGMLGCDFLIKYKAQIDFEGRMIAVTV